ncbi:MAG: hypothetical protein LBS83_02155 [Holosporales bacterium]|jgi:hypothetical protein|nr:hypothetical protein [Holosporales bacterium]
MFKNFLLGNAFLAVFSIGCAVASEQPTSSEQSDITTCCIPGQPGCEKKDTDDANKVSEEVFEEKVGND